MAVRALWSFCAWLRVLRFAGLHRRAAKGPRRSRANMRPAAAKSRGLYGRPAGYVNAMAGNLRLSSRPSEAQRSESRDPVITEGCVVTGSPLSGPTKIAGNSSAARIVSHRRFSWVPGAGTTRVSDGELIQCERG